MRILFLFPDTLDEGKYRGGVAEFLLALTPELTKLQTESIIYTRDKSLDKLSSPRQLCDGVKIYKGPFTKPSIFFGRKKLSLALKLCSKEKINLIHAQGTYTAGFMAMQIYKKTGIPYVVTSHSDVVTTNSERIKRENVKRRCQQILNYAKAVTHLTPTMAEASHELFDTRKKSTLITNGINLLEWLPYAHQKEKNYLLAIGRLEMGKGFHILIDAMAKSFREGVTTSLIIAGTGTHEKNLQTQAENLGLNVITNFSDFDNIPEKSIIFTGYVNGETKKQLISHAKSVLFATQPTIWEEAFGIVLLETMAAGKPLIASKTHSAMFLNTQGLEAIFVTPDKINEWVNAIKFLLQDDTLRKNMGEKNLINAKQFDWSVIASAYHDVFQHCLKDQLGNSLCQFHT